MDQWKPHDKSEYSCPSLVPIEGRKTIQLDGFKNTRKLEVEIMISCPMISPRTTSDEMGHNPQAQDLPRSKHILAKGKTLEEVTILSTNDL